MNSEVSITIAVPTCNRADVLRRALHCLTTQDTGGEFTYEILVVDNGSTDNTPEMVWSLDPGAATSIRHVVEASRGIPFVRNRAVKECRSPWLAFFDDDQLTSPTWLKTLYQTALEKNARFVGGARDLLIEEAQDVALSKESRMLLGEMTEAEPQFYHRKFLPSTRNVLIQTSVFEEVGAFDPTVLDGGEDSDFFNRVVSRGAVGFYNPAALVHHLIPLNRIDPSYVRWVAFRHGIHLARRDVRHQGKAMAGVLAVLRCGQAVTVFFPQKVMSKWAGDAAEVVGWECRLSKLHGYLNFLYSQAVPLKSNVRRLQQRSMHRGQREA